VAVSTVVERVPEKKNSTRLVCKVPVGKHYPQLLSLSTEKGTG